jgi:thymidylate synthase (FAD)
LLIEFGGRLCYQSFATPRPGGHKAYIDHILESGHGCYDAATEVLTASGWKHWASATEQDLFATRSQSGKIEYHRPIGLNSYMHRGAMYRVESRGVDLLVTPNHNMLVCPTTTRVGRDRQDYQLIRASELDMASHAYIKDGDWEPTCPYVGHWTADSLAMLGFAIGDGNGSGRRIRFHLRRGRKIAWLAHTATRLGWQLWGEGDRFEVVIPESHRSLFGEMYTDDGEKQIPQSVLMLAGPEQLRGLYEGLIESDGHRGRTGTTFDTTSDRLVGQFQQLCLHIGCAANISYRIEADRRRGCYGQKPLTRLSVITRELRPEVNKTAESVGRSSWIDDWQGMVFCAQVPNNTLYVRRDGKPVWCGNSVLEHAVFNIAISGVDRSFTHELVRHRAGTAFSQLSQRFVDESDCRFVVPMALADEVRAAKALMDREGSAAGPAIVLCDPDLHERIGLRWIECVEFCRDAYEVLSNRLYSKYADIPDKTLRRKRAREAARSVLPEATETRILFTANARALRHFCEMRGDIGADQQIRRVALKVLALMQAEMPQCFGDYALDRVAGQDVVSTPYRKT